MPSQQKLADYACNAEKSSTGSNEQAGEDFSGLGKEVVQENHFQPPMTQDRSQPLVAHTQQYEADSDTSFNPANDWQANHWIQVTDNRAEVTFEEHVTNLTNTDDQYAEIIGYHTTGQRSGMVSLDLRLPTREEGTMSYKIPENDESPFIELVESIEEIEIDKLDTTVEGATVPVERYNDEWWYVSPDLDRPASNKLTSKDNGNLRRYLIIALYVTIPTSILGVLFSSVGLPLSFYALVGVIIFGLISLSWMIHKIYE